MACISMIYDVLEDIVVDGVIQHYNCSEREAARKHLSQLESFGITEKSVVVFDRGYPSYDFYKYFNENNYFF